MATTPGTSPRSTAARSTSSIVVVVRTVSAMALPPAAGKGGCADHAIIGDVPGELWSVNLGTVEYGQAHALQERMRRARQAGAIPDTLLLLEHPPVYTRGRRSEAGELGMGEDWYRARGIDIVDVDRGGKVTYHGPGQLVGYPIVAIDDVMAYVATLEGAIVAGLADGGTEAGGGAPRGEARAPPRGHRVDRRVGRGPQARVDRAPRLAGRREARLRRERRQLARPVRVDRAVRAARRRHDVGGGRGAGRRTVPAVLPQADGVALRGGARGAAAAGVAGAARGGARCPGAVRGSLGRIR